MSKKLILVSGEKGGVGKSFVSRRLKDFYLENSLPCTAFDTDSTNATLKRYFPNDSKLLDLTNHRELDEVLALFEQGQERILLDGAARSLDALIGWMKETDFPDLAVEHDITMSLCFVLSPEKDCVQILKDYSEELKNFPNWILIKNQFIGSDFSIFDQSETKRKLVSDWGATEISLSPLYERPVRFMDQRNLTFLQATQDPSLGLADRQRVKSWLRQSGEELEKVRTWL